MKERERPAGNEHKCNRIRGEEEQGGGEEMTGRNNLIMKIFCFKDVTCPDR